MKLWQVGTNRQMARNASTGRQHAAGLSARNASAGRQHAAGGRQHAAGPPTCSRVERKQLGQTRDNRRAKQVHTFRLRFGQLAGQKC